MKKIFVSILVALALSGLCRAETVYTPDQPDHLISYMTNATDVGVLSFTNEIVEPWQFSSIWLQAPALITNTMTVSMVRRFDEARQEQGELVETNDFGQVVTNWYHTITNVVSTTMTNGIIVLQATNLLTGYADGEVSAVKFPNGLYALPGDVFRFSFSYTNAVKFGFDGVR